MPVKWTAENDHLLLLTLLETHQIKVDGDKISQAWPQSAGEKPTPRAIRERIVKIRSKTGSSPAKASAGSHLNNGVKKEGSPKKRTPGRPRQKKLLDDLDQDDEEIISFSSAKDVDAPASSFNNADDVEGTPCPSPPKRRRVGRPKKEPQPNPVIDWDSSDPIVLDDSEDEFVPTKVEFDDDDDDYRGE